MKDMQHTAASAASSGGPLCPTCGAELPAGSAALTPLEEHVLDRADPHGTLDLVPRTWVGPGAPASADGYRPRDWYVDSDAHASYVCVAGYPGGAARLSWVRATPDPGVDRAALGSALAGYATLASLDAAVAGCVSRAEAGAFATKSDLAPFVTPAYLEARLAGLAPSDVAAGLVTRSELGDAVAAAVAGLVTPSSLDAALAGYLTRTAADGRYVLAGSLSGYARASDVSAAVSGRVFRQPLSPGVWPDLDLDNVIASSLAPYLAKAEAASLYATRAEVAALASAGDVADAVAGCVTPASLAAALAPYATLEYASSAFLTPSDLSSYATLADVASATSGLVYRRPAADGSSPGLDLDAVLSGYLTSEDAAATYLTREAASSFAGAGDLAGLVRAADLPSYLSGYATEDAVRDLASGYATREWVESRGFALDADVVKRSDYRRTQYVGALLGAHTVDTLDVSGLSSTDRARRPPSVRAVNDAVTTLRGRIASGRSIHVFHDVLTRTEAFTGFPAWSNRFVLLPRFRMNYLIIDSVEDLAAASGCRSGPSSDWALSERFQVMLGYPGEAVAEYYGEDSAFDARLCVRFVASPALVAAGYVGQVPWTSALIVEPARFPEAEADVLGADGLLDGVSWGDAVVFAFTEVAPHVYAASRKVYRSS
jgi:hypothetical protein